jgi:hypothetical protein
MTCRRVWPSARNLVIQAMTSCSTRLRFAFPGHDGHASNVATTPATNWCDLIDRVASRAQVHLKGVAAGWSHARGIRRIGDVCGVLLRPSATAVFNVLAMGLNPSPSGETFRFFVC